MNKKSKSPEPNPPPEMLEEAHIELPVAEGWGVQEGLLGTPVPEPLIPAAPALIAPSKKRKRASLRPEPLLASEDSLDAPAKQTPQSVPLVSSEASPTPPAKKPKKSAVVAESVEDFEPVVPRPRLKPPKLASTNTVQVLARKNIRLARKHYQLSQEDFGAIVGQTGAYMSLVETGKRTITLELLEKLSLHFTLPLGYWFRENDQERILDSLEVERILKDWTESHDIHQYYVYRTIEIRVWLKPKNFRNEQLKNQIQEALIKASLEKEQRTIVIFESL